MFLLLSLALNHRDSLKLCYWPQFPFGTTIHDVYKTLSHQHKYNMESDPWSSRVQEIMAIRDEMGIGLPETLPDEAILVILPRKSRQMDSSVKIAAWETMNDEYIESRPGDYDAGWAPASHSNINETRFSSITDGNDSFDNRSDGVLASLSASICFCNTCTPSSKLNIIKDSNYFPIVSIRGGNGDSDEGGNQE